MAAHCRSESSGSGVAKKDDGAAHPFMRVPPGTWGMSQCPQECGSPRVLTALNELLDYSVELAEGTRQPMLPPFIIEQIRQREEQERLRRDAEQPRLELPLEIHQPARRPPQEEEEEVERGVTILDLG